MSTIVDELFHAAQRLRATNNATDILCFLVTQDEYDEIQREARKLRPMASRTALYVNGIEVRVR